MAITTSLQCQGGRHTWRLTSQSQAKDGAGAKDANAARAFVDEPQRSSFLLLLLLPIPSFLLFPPEHAQLPSRASADDGPTFAARRARLPHHPTQRRRPALGRSVSLVLSICGTPLVLPRFDRMVRDSRPRAVQAPRSPNATQCMAPQRGDAGSWDILARVEGAKSISVGEPPQARLGEGKWWMAESPVVVADAFLQLFAKVRGVEIMCVSGLKELEIRDLSQFSGECTPHPHPQRARSTG